MTQLSESSFSNPEASNLLKEYTNKIHGPLVGEIEVRPGEQTQMSLGIFHEGDSLKGFAIQPLPTAEDELTARIVRIDQTDATYELILHVANYNTSTADVEIRKIV